MLRLALPAGGRRRSVYCRPYRRREWDLGQDRQLLGPGDLRQRGAGPTEVVAAGRHSRRVGVCLLTVRRWARERSIAVGAACWQGRTRGQTGCSAPWQGNAAPNSTTWL